MSTVAPQLESPKVRWDLSALYSGLDDPKVAQTWAQAHNAADAFASQYRDKIGNLSATELAAALRAIEGIFQEMSKPEIYASLRFAVEADNAEVTAFMQ